MMAKFSGLVLTTVILLSAIPIAVDGTTYSSDVDITTPTVWSSDVISIYGNLTIHSTLDIEDCTIVMETDGSYIKAVTGSTLNISGTEIRSGNTNIHYSIFIDEGVNFSLTDSHFDNFGSKDPERLSSASSGAEYNEYNRYLWILADFTRDLTLSGNDGFEIRSTVDRFSNNTFTNYTVIRIYSSDNLVEHNTFDHMCFEGLAFMTGSNNNIIRHNVFQNALRMNREIFGLRFYPGCSYNEIAYNHFEWIPTSSMVGNIPPWTTGRYFEFHHNTARKVIFGIGGNLQYANIHHNHFEDIMSTGISLEANLYTVVHNNTIRNINFQRELEDVIDQNYYTQVNGRGILPNMAYWMFGFYCSKFMMALGWSAYRVTIKDNLFENAPPYTMALNMDTPQIMDRVFVINNTFRNIGTYVADNYKIKRDYTGYNAIANVTPLDGGCILLERAEKVYIEDNRFLNVLHGVVTSAPDALGNFGNFTIRDNFFKGVSSYKWSEQRSPWWSGDHPTVGEGIGIATGMNWIGGTHETYYYDSQQYINNNTFYNFKYPMVVDLSRSSSTLGIKTAYIRDNLFLNYSQNINIFDPPNNVIYGSNVYKPVYPDSLGNITKIDDHTKMVSNDYHLIPLDMTIPWFSANKLVKWNNISMEGGNPEDLYYTTDGNKWQRIPADGDLGSAIPDTGKIMFKVRSRSYEVETSSLVLTYTTNSPVNVDLVEQVKGIKHEPVHITADVDDMDDSEFSYKWHYVEGPETDPEMDNTTSGTMVFTPGRSGTYKFEVEVGDGFSRAWAKTEVTVANTGPTLEVTCNITGYKMELITMTAAVGDADNDDLSIRWTQLSGPAVNITNSTDLTAGFTTGAVGTYLFSVVVSDGEWSNYSRVKVFVMGNAPWAVLETGSVPIFENEALFLSAGNSSDPDGSITAYLFDFGDGTDSGWINDPFISHTYSEPGSYSVYLMVKDDDGIHSHRAYIIVNISRRMIPPVASFSVLPERGDVNTLFKFNSTSYDEDGAISKWVWDFGDGNAGKGEKVKHRFATPGNHTVVLKITDGEDLEAHIEKTIVVVLSLKPPNHPPEVRSYQPERLDTAIEGKRYHFNITAVDPDNDKITISWYLNDEFLGEGTDVDITFTEDGKNTVKMIVDDGTDKTVNEWTVNVKSSEESDSARNFQRMMITAISVIVIIVVLILIFLKRRSFIRRSGDKKEEQEKSMTVPPLLPPAISGCPTIHRISIMF